MMVNQLLTHHFFFLRLNLKKKKKQGPSEPKKHQQFFDNTRNMPNYSAPGATEFNDFCIQRGLADAWLDQSYEQLQNNADGGFTHHTRH